MKFLAGARMQRGEKFNLRAFHDFVWKKQEAPREANCCQAFRRANAGNQSAVVTGRPDIRKEYH